MHYTIHKIKPCHWPGLQLTFIGHRFHVLLLLAQVLGANQAYAAVDSQSDDDGQVGDRAAHSDDDGLHHVEAVLLVLLVTVACLGPVRVAPAQATAQATASQTPSTVRTYTTKVQED